MLRCDDIETLGLQSRNEFAEARTVGPQSMNKNDAWFAWNRHFKCSFVELGQQSALSAVYTLRPFALANKDYV
jgi:hypothetical protein